MTGRLKQSPEAYLGISAQDCPNLFITPGPKGILGHASNSVFFAECHVRYIAECPRAIFERGARSMTVREDVLRAYVDELCAQLPNFVQSLPGLDNWYRGDRDRVTTIAPKSVLQFWQDCRAPNLDAYTFS